MQAETRHPIHTDPKWRRIRQKAATAVLGVQLGLASFSGYGESKPTYAQEIIPTATPTVQPEAGTIFSARTSSPEGSPQATDAVVFAAGDIVDCTPVPTDGHIKTGEIIKTDSNATVITLGDNVYESGTKVLYDTCYEPSTWGQAKRRTRPTPGNHDITSPTPQNPTPYYYTYFNVPKYYFYDLGTWHVISLDSERDVNMTEQLDWLRKDLLTNQKECTLAYWHRPKHVLTKSAEDGAGVSQPIWETIVPLGVDVVLNGHEHSYLRTKPLDANSNPIPDGTTQITAGTGGGDLIPQSYKLPNLIAASQDQNWGVLKLVLKNGSYDYDFISAAGSPLAFEDKGTATCANKRKAKKVFLPNVQR